jgi:hypothetical protein
MTKLTDTDVAEFAQLIREDYGVELNPEDARREAENVMRFALLILHPPNSS